MVSAMGEDIRTTPERTKITVTTEDVVSVPCAARELGVHFATVYRWIEKGIIHPFRIGGQVFVTRDEIRALKEQREKV